MEPMVTGASDSRKGVARRAALLIAHPGHELRVHGWLEQARPCVFVLTDGSGHTGSSRLASTTRVLDRAGARRGSVYGRFTDREVYQAILDADAECFRHLAGELAAALVREEIEVVAGDEAEGYNPGHDLIRLVANAAVALVQQTTGASVENLQFPLTGPSDRCPADLRARAWWVRLDDRALRRKRAAARAYRELRAEFGVAVGGLGTEAFRVECLRPVESTEYHFPQAPFYEQHGERQVAAGIYDRVLRYREHVVPIAEALGAVPAAGVR